MRSETENKYYMPAEWDQHKGTLVSWPSNHETWEGVENEVRQCMANLISIISQYEEVYVSTKPHDNKSDNDDAWTRDYGPNYAFCMQNNRVKKYINNWGYNAWGGKYPPWNNDLIFKRKFAEWIGCLNISEPNMILEGD